jgi:hypothetical protein
MLQYGRVFDICSLKIMQIQTILTISDGRRPKSQIDVSSAQLQRVRPQLRPNVPSAVAVSATSANAESRVLHLFPNVRHSSDNRTTDHFPGNQRVLQDAAGNVQSLLQRIRRIPDPRLVASPCAEDASEGRGKQGDVWQGEQIDAYQDTTNYILELLV